jgi:hypothetical protein
MVTGVFPETPGTSNKETRFNNYFSNLRLAALVKDLSM